MPTGYTRAWVYKNNDSYDYLQKPPGWQFIPDADVAALKAAGNISPVGELPQRNLPMPDNAPTPVARVTAPPSAP